MPKRVKKKAEDRRSRPALQRMVFRDISAQRFTWDWEVSGDDGATWTTQWRIEYTRATR